MQMKRLTAYLDIFLHLMQNTRMLIVENAVGIVYNADDFVYGKPANL